MFLKSFLALCLALTATAACAEPLPPLQLMNLNNVRLVHCSNTKGTAFAIGDGKLVTAYHVVQNGNCTDVKTGTVLTVEIQDKDKDFALLTTKDKADEPFVISCKGLKRDKNYYSIGWSGGFKLHLQRLLSTDYVTPDNFVLVAKGFPDQPAANMRVLKGVIHGGASGGPVIESETGLVVGINNGNNVFERVGFVRDLKDTVLCKGR